MGAHWATLGTANNNIILHLRRIYTLHNYTGWPKNNGTVDTVDFQDFALIYSYVLYFVG